MISAALLSIFSLTALLIASQLSPGPDVCLVFRTALSQGWRAGGLIGLGVTVGVVIHALLVCLMGQWLFEQSWMNYVLLAGAAWLFYLVYKIITESVLNPKGAENEEQELMHDIDADAEPQRDSGPSTVGLVVQGFLCNILNPKCTLFIAGICMGGLQRYAAVSWYAPTLLVCIAITGPLGWLTWSILLQWGPIRRYYLAHLRLIDTCFAALLAAFGILLLLGGLGLRA